VYVWHIPHGLGNGLKFWKNVWGDSACVPHQDRPRVSFHFLPPRSSDPVPIMAVFGTPPGNLPWLLAPGSWLVPLLLALMRRIRPEMRGERVARLFPWLLAV
jgi:hypothetical protein